MEAVEIVFAQRLASGEPITRKRALKHLREHIKEESAKEGGAILFLSGPSRGEGARASTPPPTPKKSEPEFF